MKIFGLSSTLKKKAFHTIYLRCTGGWRAKIQITNQPFSGGGFPGIARCHRRHADRLREPDSTTLWYLQIGPEVEKIC